MLYATLRFEIGMGNSLPVSKRGPKQSDGQSWHTLRCVCGVRAQPRIQSRSTTSSTRVGIARRVCSTKQPKTQSVQSQAVFVYLMCGCVCKCCWKLNVDFCVVVSWCERRTCVKFQLKSKIRDSFGRFGTLYRAISIKTISLH